MKTEIDAKVLENIRAARLCLNGGFYTDAKDFLDSVLSTTQAAPKVEEVTVQQLYNFISVESEPKNALKTVYKLREKYPNGVKIVQGDGS